MPKIITQDKPVLDSKMVQSIMLWPESEEKRHHFLTVDSVKGILGSIESNGAEVWETSLIQSLLDAPSSQEILDQVRYCTKRAVIAGNVFNFMFFMDRLKDRLPPRGAKGASINKAIYLATQWAKTGATFGDGSKMLVSDRLVQECWQEYRSVAHLWAAYEINRIFPVSEMNQKFVHPENFQNFMEAGAYMQMFGTTHQMTKKSTKTAESLQSLDSIWAVDVQRFMPRIYMPSDLNLFNDAPFIAMLNAYKS
ncbi:MAG: hypothetical protein H7293_09750 [Candidatus Saccharibacteria bacterium]|nr:hypothetical protein [Rhodoferax sp.]